MLYNKRGDCMKNNMLKFTSFFLTVFLILTGCKKEETFKRAYYKTVYDVYNTHVNLSSFNQKDLDNLFPGFSALAVSLHKDFDRDAKYLNEDYNFFNNLKVVNDAYGTGQTIKVSDNLFYV